MLIFIRRFLHYFRTTIKVMNKIKTCIVIWLIVITAGLAGVMIFNYLKKLPGDCISMKPIPDISQLRQFFKDSNINYFRGERVIHLDLKGAPPSLAYFEKIFPLFQALGATSVLIEYEHMFPYRDTSIRAINAFSRDDIEALKRLTKKNNLTIIPLVQTFGHLEFLLKLKNFSYLREDFNYTDSICPSHNSTFHILTGMLDEVIEAHPKIRYIHIGCDEVFHMGLCKKCKEEMTNQHWENDDLFLNHVARLANYIRTKYPSITPLIWDDHLRSMPVDKLEKFNIGILVEPMVWYYEPRICLSSGMWQKYAQVFRSVWVASSFKGATGANKITTDISHHVANHISWMFVMQKYASLINFKGVVITGWQRYDHFAVLCELLPVSIPSLAHVCLVLDGSNSNRERISPNIRSLLACGLNKPSSDTCDFPGDSIYLAIVKFSQLRGEIDLEVNEILANKEAKRYLTSRNLDSKNLDRPMAENISSMVKKYSTALKQVEVILKQALGTVYDNYTITEWIQTYVQPYNVQLNNMSDAFHVN